MTRPESFYTQLEQLSPGEITHHFAAETLAGFYTPSYINFYAGYRFDDVFLGHGDLDLSLSGKQIRWGKFYPHDTVDLYQTGRKGIGTLAHLSILLGINNLITQAKQTDMNNFMVIHDSPSGARTLMLNRMGIDPRTPLNFKDYFERSLEYAKRKNIVIAILEKRILYSILGFNNFNTATYIETAVALNCASEVTPLDPEDHLVCI